MTKQWKQSKGLTIIYVGDGKGKTTAAMGAVVRALGHGWKVYVAQFMKEEKWPSGERDFFHLFNLQWSDHCKLKLYKLGKVDVDVVGEGFVGIMGDKKEREMHEVAAQTGYEKAMKIITNTLVPESGRGATATYQLVILDEILSAVDEGLLTEQQILDVMAKKPEEVTLIMTGHKSYPTIFAKADLVTEMKKLKHPFDEGFIAKKGIDY